ncbi:MAG: SPFH domain-containing protein [Leucobacter sp.]|nr:SPFH domain-containing protein [Leucobacter sp.]
MGLVSAASAAFGGVFGDQWKDFYTIPAGLHPTSAMFAAVQQSSNSGRGVNHWGSAGVISNGSKILVPEGYALVLMEDGGVTGFVAQPGAYEWRSDALDSQSIFAGDGIVSPLIRQSWERFKFGGRPQSQQYAFFVSLKELPNNRFGTPMPIYWDDAYLNAQAGGHTRGTYTIRIVDPILFIRNWVSAKYLQPGVIFDFTDPNNDASKQLFNEVVSSLSQALSRYANDSSRGNRMTMIQQDSAGFAQALSEAVERNYQWRSGRGLEIASTAVLGIEYDERTRALLDTVQRADALLGARGNSNMQASVAAGIQAAGESGEGASGIIGLAMTTGMVGLSGLQQATGAGSQAVSSVASAETVRDETAPVQQAPVATDSADRDDVVLSFTKLKELFESDLITQAEYEAAKAKLLGI